MGDVVNLNRFRKARDKAAEKAQARANRVLHGRTKGEKASELTEAERADRALDGARIEDDEPA